MLPVVTAILGILLFFFAGGAVFGYCIGKGYL